MVFERSSRFSIDTKSIVKEMENFQRIRLANRLDTSKDDLIKQIIDNSCRDQSFRSRLAEISFTAVRSQHILEKSIDSVRRKIVLNYKDELYSTLKTQSERQNAIDDIMSSLLAYINDMKQLSELANIYIMDIDKGAWSLKLMVEAISIHTHKEQIVG